MTTLEEGSGLSLPAAPEAAAPPAASPAENPDVATPTPAPTEQSAPTPSGLSSAAAEPIVSLAANDEAAPQPAAAGDAPSPGAQRIAIPVGPNGPTPEQLAQIQQKLQEEAAQHGMTVTQYVDTMRRQQEMAMARMKAAQEQIMAQNGGTMPLGPDGQPIKIGMTPQGHPIPIVIGPNGQPIPVGIGPNGQVFPLRPPGAPGSAAGGSSGENPSVEELEERKRMIQAQMRAQIEAQQKAAFEALTPEQQEAAKQQIAQQKAAFEAMTPEQKEEFKQQVIQKQAAMRAAAMQQEAAQRGGPMPGQPQEIRPGPPNPVALALMAFLRSQDLKPRTVILNDTRKEMFKVKRALRVLQSPAYEKARKKNPALPEITDRASLENTFKLLPMSMLALRVEKQDPHAGHNHGPGGHAGKKTKRIKGLWTVGIIKQQDAADDMYYIWMTEGSQVKTRLYAALALVLIFLVVCYPLWPLKLRQGVYYLSWGFLGLLALFFAMAIFRVILFCITYMAVPPGLWLYPNLWEDVSFMDSFRPVWAWHDPNPKKRKSKKSKNTAAINAQFSASQGIPPAPEATTTATNTQINTESGVSQRTTYAAPNVEEVNE